MNPSVYRKSLARNGKTAAASWRRFAALTVGLGGLVSSARADLLVYEGFDYISTASGAQLNADNLTSLHGQSGGTGFATVSDPVLTGEKWVAGQTNTTIFSSPAGFAICNSSMSTIWSGVSTSLTQTGKFAGSPAPVLANGTLTGNNPDHLFAWRLIDPAVTATFTLGATTWMCFQQCSNFKANANGLGASFVIGAGHLGTTGSSGDRGKVSYGGGAVGILLDYSDHNFKAAAWGNGTAGGTGVGVTATAGDPTASMNGGTGPASVSGNYPTTNNTTSKICLAKIVWGDLSNATVIKLAVFNEGAALPALNEQGFDNIAVSYTVPVNFNPLTYNKIALGGARYNVDELRIGTTLNDAIGVVAATDGPYWAPDLAGGGSGTWATGQQVWATAPFIQGAVSQSPTLPLIFAGTTGIVTINDMVTVAAGIQFSTDLYSLVAGTGSPNLTLSGASIAVNSITVDSAKTATIGVVVNGSNGLTKTGAGTLVLDNGTNGYSGSTALNDGTLQIPAPDSLGSSTVTFGGGTLKLAAAIDVSTKIAPIATGQVAKIDTNGNVVTFAGSLTGTGGLTKSGAGSLALTGGNGLLGPVTCAAGTLNIDSSSGLVVDLRVPAGGTVNLGAGAMVTNLQISGGTVNITGAGVTVGTLNGSSGTLVCDPNTLAVTTRATLAGVGFELAGGTAITLSGANVIDPDTTNPRTLTANGGLLSLDTPGLDAAIGIANPGSNASPTMAVLSGGGVWTLTGGAAATCGNAYGKDNHAFHYVRIPPGDFEIKARVTGSVNSQPGLMVRNNLASSPPPTPLPPLALPTAPAGTGHWIAIWKNRVGSTKYGAEPNVQNITTGSTPYLKITRVGNIFTAYYGSNGIDYTQSQQINFSNDPSAWGDATYIGLDLSDTTTSSVSGSFAEVNFMGTASVPEMSTTSLNLINGSKLALTIDDTIELGGLSINGVPQPGGAYGTATTSPLPDYVNNTSFTESGTLYVITTPGAPTGLVATPGNTTVNLTWNAVIGATSYQVFRSETPGGPYATPLATSFNAYYTDSSLTNGTSYYYVVKATNTAGTSGESTEVGAVPVDPPYQVWAALKGLTGFPGSETDPAFGADPDNDDIDNGLEWILGGDPLASDTSVLPQPTRNLDGSLTLKFKRALTSVGKVTLRVQYGANLRTWKSVVVGVIDSPADLNGVTVDVEVFNAEYDTITVNIPDTNASDGAQFARVSVLEL